MVDRFEFLRDFNIEIFQNCRKAEFMVNTIFIKEINNRQMKKQKADISSASNRYSKENGNKKGMFSFPIINKIIYGREDKNDFAEIKEKLYLEYLDKRKNKKHNINIPIEKESEEEEESEEQDD